MTASLILPLLYGGVAWALPPRRGISLLLAMAVPLVLSAWLLSAVRAQGPQIMELAARALPGMQLQVDGLRASLLILTGGLVTAGSLAAMYDPQRLTRLYWPLMGILWASLTLIWLAGDLLTIYIGLEVLGLSAVWLMVLSGSDAITAGLRYLFYMLLGSLAFLLGVALMLGATGVLDLAGLRRAAAPVASQQIALALMTAGLWLKAAVFPLHGWLPPAHASAFSFVSAIHSALVVKAYVFITVQLWRVLPVSAEPAAQFMGFLGACAIFWAGFMAWRHRQLKFIIAYSTISQMGYLLLIFPLSVGAGDQAAELAWQGTWLFFLAHALAKAALFLAAGNMVLSMGRGDLDGLSGVGHLLPLPLMIMGLASITIIGLPPSGGFSAKWLLLMSAVLGRQWQWVSVLLLGTLLTAAYIFRVFRYAFVAGKEEEHILHQPLWVNMIALVLALAAAFLGLYADSILSFLNLPGNRL